MASIVWLDFHRVVMSHDLDEVSLAFPRNLCSLLESGGIGFGMENFVAADELLNSEWIKQYGAG